MSAMLGNVPFAAGYGIGKYTPAAFLLATIVLTVFSIGYAAMAARISSVGGFYSFISQGLGREVGMSAGIASLACYSVFEASLTGLFAFFGNLWISQHFGVNVPWIVLALGMIVVIAALAYRDVKLSARLLGIALILEVIILAIFALGVLLTSQVTNFSAESLNVFKVFTPVAEQTVGTVAIPAGAAAVGVFMAFWSWVGFEMAPNYAEESRDPKRIIPLSLLISVIGLGVFYTFVSWCAVAAYPTEADMVAKAFSDGVNFFLTPIQNFVGGWAYELMSVLILTSSFACGMAFHNTASRYMYSLAREGVLPKMVAETHDHHKSPHKASAVQSVLAAVWVLLYGFSYGFDDPSGQAWLGVYTLFAVLGTGLLLDAAGRGLESVRRAGAARERARRGGHAAGWPGTPDGAGDRGRANLQRGAQRSRVHEVLVRVAPRPAPSSGARLTIPIVTARRDRFTRRACAPPRSARGARSPRPPSPCPAPTPTRGASGSSARRRRCSASAGP